MNIRLLVSIFLTVSASLRAGPPTEFLDIPWGSPIAEAKRILTQRPGASLKAETELKLTYIGGTFATYPVDRYELEMFEGHLVKGKVFLVMPSGTAKNGGLLSDHQFEDLCKSLTSKYGKVPRITDGQHAESNWSWTTTNPRTRQKRTTEVRLSYWFFRREFSISYSNLPTAPVAAESQDAKLKEETKKKDL